MMKNIFYGYSSISLIFEATLAAEYPWFFLDEAFFYKSSRELRNACS